MLARMLVTLILLSSVTCGDDLLDLNENQLRIIASELRGAVRSETSQCQAVAKYTVQTSLGSADDDADIKCLSLPDELVCQAQQCTCRSDGDQDDDDNYRARCMHTEDGKTTTENHTFSADDISSANTPPPTTTPPDEEEEEEEEPVEPIEPPVGGTPAECHREGENTLSYGELLLKLATDTPVLVRNEIIVDMTCTSSEQRGVRNLRCESSDCACTASFQLNRVPNQANCMEL